MNKPYRILLAEAKADLRFGKFEANMLSGDAFRLQVERNAHLAEIEQLLYEVVKADERGEAYSHAIYPKLDRVAEIRKTYPRFRSTEVAA